MKPEEKWDRLVWVATFVFLAVVVGFVVAAIVSLFWLLSLWIGG